MLLSASVALAGPEDVAISGVAVVVDADTLIVDQLRVRIWGIDAPELSQLCTSPNGAEWKCGEAARDVLRILVLDPVTCHPVERDRWGRVVAVCEVGGVDLAASMVRAGCALDYAKYSKAAFAEDEAAAKAAGRGVWASSFEQPWKWRAARR